MQTIYKNYLSILMATCLFQSCGRPDHSSDFREAPSTKDTLSEYGYELNLFYDDLVKHREFNYRFEDQNTMPWEDSYWPTLSQGIARRWDFSEGRIGNTSLPSFGKILSSLITKFDRHFQRDGQSAIWNMTYLSPAEKYDYLSMIAQIKDDSISFSEFIEKDAIELLLRNVERIESQLEFDIEAVKYDSSLDETQKRDKLNLLQKEHVNQLYELMLSSKILYRFPLFLEGWGQWAARVMDPKFAVDGKNKASDDEMTWSWEGLCHGWAPASIMEEKPKNSVLADIRGYKVLFTEGDIRGLLTKAWSEQAPKKGGFLSGRCNQSPSELYKFEYERFGRKASRPADGFVCNNWNRLTNKCEGKSPFAITKQFAVMAKNDEKILAFEYDWIDEQGQSNTGLALPIETISMNRVRFLPFNKNAIRGYLSRNSDETDFTIFLPFKQIDELYQFILDYQSGHRPIIRPHYFRFQNCRDTNPGTFVALLIQFFQDPDHPKGFIIDRTAENEVWNQPVFGYQLNLSEPVSIQKVDDQIATFRAPGTQYLVDTQIWVKFIAEPSYPIFDYGDRVNREHINRIKILATLELDKNYRVIGGEWGSLNSIYPEQQQPDFAYFYTKDSHPHEEGSLKISHYDKQDDPVGTFNIKILRQIHRCSLDEKREIKSINMPQYLGRWVRKDIPYVECEITLEP